MSSDDSESESEDCRFFHWNNWSAPDDVKTFCEHNQQKGNNSKNYMVSCKEPTAPPSVALMEDKTDRFKSWIPPTDLVFKNRTYRKGNIKILSDNESKTTAINCEPNSAELSTYSSQLLPDMSSQYCPDLQLSKWNSDWNERSELHDVTNFNDGDMIWDVIDPGIFEVMKLWINKYGNICGKAEGKISKQGSSEKAFLLINTPENLRKLLNIKNLEWSFLCESLQTNQIILAYDTWEARDISKMSSLEKLWYFLCKRRHFLPGICVQAKLNGAVKLMKALRILPKLIVQDVRSIKGHPID